MKTLSPKDASILAVIAENTGTSRDRIMALVHLADDVEEVEAVAVELLNGASTNGSAQSADASASAKALRHWVEENRALGLRD